MDVVEAEMTKWVGKGVPVICSCSVGLCQLLVRPDMFKTFINQVQGLPQKVPCKSCLNSRATFLDRQPWQSGSSCMKPEFIDEKNYGDTCRNFAVWCVLCASLCFSSHVSPARPWPRPFNKTPPWRTWIWVTTTSEMKGPRLGVRWGWDHEGRSAVKKYRKEGSRHSRMKETSGKWRKAMQCSVDFQMHSSGWNLWWQVIVVFWCIWHVLARSWSKREQFITVLFPKRVALSFSNSRSSNQVWNGIPIMKML